MHPDLPALRLPPDPARLPLPPAERPADGVVLHRGAPYAFVPGFRPLELDLWLPADAGAPLPVILYVHGGAWRAGRRSVMSPLTRDWTPGPFARMARAGFAVASVDYRLSGGAPYPAQLEDVTAARTWLAARTDLDLDVARTVLWGESAGALLASLAALTTPARACVAWYGHSDLPALAEHHPDGESYTNDPATPEARLLGAPVARAPRAREASPVTHVTASAPPFLLVHGTEDSLVPHRQSEHLAEALRRAGADATLDTVPGADHMWLGVPGAEVERVFADSLAFALRHTA
ncbi:hypothetical protein GCM10009678_55120 [Actinomadura kijaniata]|uniref:Acetyl esterase/lipase n=1 Tax=Actinomadura namibiensis TaxID=182080 RepID=A0A7W3LLG2_ACTNM|nr:alpha/beta hydrolase [Actinomadura namibiensis]MBA8950273.1 acetyl esterase/lipase [Actinomadura namibiensis]